MAKNELIVAPPQKRSVSRRSGPSPKLVKVEDDNKRLKDRIKKLNIGKKSGGDHIFQFGASAVTGGLIGYLEAENDGPDYDEVPIAAAVGGVCLLVAKVGDGKVKEAAYEGAKAAITILAYNKVTEITHKSKIERALAAEQKAKAKAGEKPQSPAPAAKGENEGVRL